MKRIPGSREVRSAIRVVRKQLKAALKATNVLAGKRIAKGDYATAESLTASAKAIQHFQVELQTMEQRWKELSGVSNRAGKHATTPLWQYYQPLLQALVKAGGECRREELEEHIERFILKSLLAGDNDTVSGGRKRWQLMVHRARKPLAAEGWIERRGGKTWRITNEGRKVAERPGATEAQLLAKTPPS